MMRERLTDKEYKLIQVKRLQINQRELAKHLNVSESFFSLWLSGQKKSSRLEINFDRFYQKHITK